MDGCCDGVGNHDGRSGSCPVGVQFGACRADRGAAGNGRYDIVGTDSIAARDWPCHHQVHAGGSSATRSHRPHGGCLDACCWSVIGACGCFGASGNVIRWLGDVNGVRCATSATSATSTTCGSTCTSATAGDSDDRGLLRVVIRNAFRAMGTDVVVVSEDDDRGVGVRDWFETVEQVCSRFRVDSELSQLNRAGAGPIKVSAVLADVLRCADRSRLRTAGLVDAGSGGAVIEWGYDRTFADVRDREIAPSTVSSMQWSIDGDLVSKAHDTKIDLGGIAKGWACDVAVEQGMARLVSAGGDLRSVEPDAAAIIVGADGEAVGTVLVGCGALATSSTRKRRWLTAGREAHHLIDPRSGSPAVSPVVSATVVADTAAEAEAGAKAVLLKGVDGLAWADQCAWLRGALVIWDDGSVYATTGLKVTA